jgi:hypothetical protein
MNSKLTTIILLVLFLAAAAFGFYQHNRAAALESKYEEALVDMEEAYKRLEEKDLELQNTLKLAEAAREEADRHRLIAEEALQKKSGK